MSRPCFRWRCEKLQFKDSPESFVTVKEPLASISSLLKTRQMFPPPWTIYTSFGLFPLLAIRS